MGNDSGRLDPWSSLREHAVHPCHWERISPQQLFTALLPLWILLQLSHTYKFFVDLLHVMIHPPTSSWRECFNVELLDLKGAIWEDGMLQLWGNCCTTWKKKWRRGLLGIGECNVEDCPECRIYFLMLSLIYSLSYYFTTKASIMLALYK